MSDQNYKVVELDSIKMEDGAKELMSTPEMQPYLRYVEAAMLGGDVDSSLRGIAELPLEKLNMWLYPPARLCSFGQPTAQPWIIISQAPLFSLDGRTTPRRPLVRRNKPLKVCTFVPKACRGSKPRSFFNPIWLHQIAGDALSARRAGQLRSEAKVFLQFPLLFES